MTQKAIHAGDRYENLDYALGNIVSIQIKQKHYNLHFKSIVKNSANRDYFIRFENVGL